MGKWKKYFMKMPSNLNHSLEKISPKARISVYSAKMLNNEDIMKGVYNHLEIHFDKQSSKLVYPSSVISKIIGKYSKYNVEDKEVKLKDLPMENYTITFDAPNFGDESKGTHLVQWEKKRYQREIIPAKGFLINIKLVNEEKRIFEFEINRTFARDDEDLFYAINLMQEVVGAVKIKVADEEIDYTSFEQVDWELFPPEEREKVFKKFLSGRDVDEEKSQVYKERLDFLESLKPMMYVYGKTGLGYYLGAKIQEDLIVFENQRYGNAIYIMFGDWDVLSKLSRTELLKRPSLNYQRVIHTGKWRDKVRGVIRTKIGSSKYAGK